MMTYNLPQHTAGDTWCGISGITIVRNGLPLDLTDAKAKINVKFQIDSPLILEFDTENGSMIILSPPTSGIIQVPPQIVDIPPANYIWSLKITLASGEVDTFVSGQWNIVKTA